MARADAERRLAMAVVGRAFLDIADDGHNVTKRDRKSARAWIRSKRCERWLEWAGIDVDVARAKAKELTR